MASTDQMAFGTLVLGLCRSADGLSDGVYILHRACRLLASGARDSGLVTVYAGIFAVTGHLAAVGAP
jgi:hypothetical protein